MAITLAQADYYTVPDLQRGIIETIIEEGKEVYDRLPFESIAGASFDYDRESTLPAVGFYSPNEVITESTGIVVRVSTTLKEILGDSDLDKFLRDTKSDKMSIEADYMRMATKSLVRFWMDKFIYGDTATNIKSFNGLHKLCDTTQVVRSAIADVNGADMSLGKIDQLIDKIKPGKPDVLIMSKRSRRLLSAAVRVAATVGYLTYGVDQFGSRVMFYDNIPILVSDFVTDTESTDATGYYASQTLGDQTSVIAVKFGAVTEGGLMGLQNGSMAQFERIDPIPNKDSVRFRVKWYTSLALGNIYSLAEYVGITGGAVGV